MSPGSVEHVVVVPSTLCLLPEYAGLEDPVPDLRAAASAAVSWLVQRHPDEVAVLSGDVRADDAERGVTEPAGARIAAHLMRAAGFRGRTSANAPGLLVVANGSARRSDKAPGHVDERALPFDESVEKALRAGDAAALCGLDAALGADLWAFDTPVLARLGELVREAEVVASEVDYADDPYGVQYWVVRWTCGS